MRVMLDTNILISVIVFKSDTINQLVKKMERGCTIVLPNTVIEESERILAWKFPALTEAFQQFLSELSFEYFHVPADLQYDYPIRDENDKKILHAVYASSSDVLITGDKDFFEQVYEDLEVLTPREFLNKY
ncbi:hypothetical protein FACS1894211_05530 [Clostridia bacterium]|nr:hypothetical protein FACS1894211_05530 [Clostridia bacterium]